MSQIDFISFHSDSNFELHETQVEEKTLIVVFFFRKREQFEQKVFTRKFPKHMLIICSLCLSPSIAVTLLPRHRSVSK